MEIVGGGDGSVRYGRKWIALDLDPLEDILSIFYEVYS
jgi:hypothetical protein